MPRFVDIMVSHIRINHIISALVLVMASWRNVGGGGGGVKSLRRGEGSFPLLPSSPPVDRTPAIFFIQLLYPFLHHFSLDHPLLLYRTAR